MKEKITELIKDSVVVLPKLLLRHYKELKITEKELIILIYILNDKDKIFNPKKVSKDLNENLQDTMGYFETLINKEIIKLEAKKINDLRVEMISLESLYNKLSHFIITEEEKETSTTIYSVFEEKIGRTLSPMEYTIIGGWLELEYTEEVILLALEEAIYNGVYKLNYIDKILYEWNKKGIKSKEDKEKNDVQYRKGNSEKKELYDYNWLEDE